MPESRTSQEWSGLVQRVLSGDTDATQQFADVVGKKLFGLFLFLEMSPTDAEELAVSCTSDIVLALENYTENGRFEAWMFQIARNQRANEFRGRPELVRLRESDWLELYDREQNGSDNLVYQNNGQLSVPVHQALEHALSQLSAADRRLIEGRHARIPATFEELGHELGLTPGNARVRFLRLIRKLKTALRSDDRIQNWLEGASPVSPSSKHS